MNRTTQPIAPRLLLSSVERFQIGKMSAVTLRHFTSSSGWEQVVLQRGEAEDLVVRWSNDNDERVTSVIDLATATVRSELPIPSGDPIEWETLKPLREAARLMQLIYREATNRRDDDAIRRHR
jgi:hypothetical protein